MNKKVFLIVIILYSLISFFQWRVPFLSDNVLLTGYSYPQDISLWVIHFADIGTAWNEYLGMAWAPFIFSITYFFALISKSFLIEPSKLVILLHIFVSTLAGVSMFILTNYFLENPSETKDNLRYIPPFLSGLIYMSSPSYMIGDWNYIFIKYGFSLLPLILFSFLKAIESNNKMYIFLLSLLLAQSVYDPRLIFSFSLVAIFYLLFTIIDSYKRGQISFNKLKNIGVAISLTIFITFIFIFPSVIIDIPQKLFGHSTAPIVKDAIVGNYNLGDSLRAMSHMSLSNFFKKDYLYFIRTSILNSLSFLIPISAFLSLIIYPKNKTVLFFSFISIFTLFIFTSDAVRFFLINLPLGVAFRTWRIQDAILSLSYGVLIAFSFKGIVKKINPLGRVKKNFIYFASIGIILISVFSWSWPLFTNNVYSEPSKIPQYYEDANNFISSDTEDFKVLWAPEMEWFSNNPYPYWLNTGQASQGFPEYNSAKPTYFHYFNQMTPYYTFTSSAVWNSLLLRNKSSSDFYSAIGVKYILIHDDVPPYSNSVNKTLINLNSDSNFKLVKQFDKIYIYQNLKYKSRFFTPHKLIVSANGLESINEFLQINNGLNLTDYGVIVSDRLKTKDILNYSDVLFFSENKNLMDINIHEIPQKYILETAKFTKYYDAVHWSPGYLSDPHQGVWHTFIGSFRENAWDYDFSYGFAMASRYSRDTLSVPFVKYDDEMIIGVRYFASSNGGLIKLDIGNDSISINTKEKGNMFKWKLFKVRSPSDDKILIQNVKGQNAINILVALPSYEFDKLKTKTYDVLIDKDFIEYHDTSTQDMALDYSFDNTSVKEILTNWKEYRNGTLEPYTLSISNSSETVGGSSLCLETNITKTWWSWLRNDVPVEPLEEYTIETHYKIYNMKQFHIAIDGYNNKTNGWFRMTNVPSGIDGTSDWEMSNEEITIPKDVTKISININSGWTINDAENAKSCIDSIQMYRNQPSKEYTSNISMESIYGEVNYSVNKGENLTIEQMLKFNTTALVSNYTKINPTLYKVKVNSTTPFMLAFAESYDSLWYARIDKINGTPVDSKTWRLGDSKIVRPVPLYSVINGFWINETGDLDITIEYEPQKWFYIGAAISLTTLVACIIYLIYDWRKARRHGDKRTWRPVESKTWRPKSWNHGWKPVKGDHEPYEFERSESERRIAKILWPVSSAISRIICKMRTSLESACQKIPRIKMYPAASRISGAIPPQIKKQLESINIPYALVLAAVVLAKFSGSESVTLAIFLLLVIIYAKNKYDSRTPIAFALLLLVISAIELAIKSEDAANAIAIYAYYFLVTGVILQLIEYIKNPGEENETD